MKKVLVVLGPTATGKTDLALLLAKKFNGELISCDSRQVYIGLDIGTGKLPGKNANYAKGQGYWLIDGIYVWAYDLVDPKNKYSVYDYINQTQLLLPDILKRQRLPILVGGTAFYLKGLLEGIPNLSININTDLRHELSFFSVGQLQKHLKTLSIQTFQAMNNSDRANPRRLIRAIEIAMYPYTVSKNKSTVSLGKSHEVLKVGLTAPRPVLNQRIDNRLISRINQGLISEAEVLYKNGLSFSRMRELGLEYGLLADLLENKINLEEFKKKLAIKIHQYAKEQMTWFKRDTEINWFDISQPNFSDKVTELVGKWYDRPINVTEN